ncbi:MAG: DUF4142 domain-containing protein [Rhodanobacteraceae bacterium]
MSGKKSAPRDGGRSETGSAIKDALGGVAPTAAAAVATGTHSFTENATSAILYELAASEAALRRSRREDVRAFATLMRDDFSRIQSDLNSFLGGVVGPTSPPERPMKLHRVLLDDLDGAADADFDHRYITQQKLAHLEAITLFKAYQKRGDNDGLKNLCRLGLPVLEEHARLADELDNA